MSPHLFRSFPHLTESEKIGWIPLVHGFTPVGSFRGAAELVGHRRLYIKREDATDSLYGGNKVRNLEFLLGTAIDKGARRVATVAPYGSNFVAALAAQAKRIGMPSDVFHFVPSMSQQMEGHARFSAEQGMRMTIRRGGRYVGSAHAQLSLWASGLVKRGTALLPPGGSSPVGALGHVNAVFELAAQIRAGEIPEPDLLIVGVGTCGTMAGLLAGIQLTGLKTKVVGVRCVDPIFCNPLHIAYLANGALRLLRSRRRVLTRDIDLRDPGAKANYGQPLPIAQELIAAARAHADVELDTTYTTKVFAYVQALAGARMLHGLDVLYWHTYSPAAMRAKIVPSRLPLEPTQGATGTATA